jgi:hypothetical protein
MSELQRKYAIECSTKNSFHSIRQEAKPIPWRDTRVNFVQAEALLSMYFRQLLEKCYEYGIEVNTIFIDCKQAFDSTDQYKLHRSLKSYGILKKLINLIKTT